MTVIIMPNRFFLRRPPPTYETQDDVKDRQKCIFLTIFLVGIPLVLAISYYTYYNFLTYNINPQRPQFRINSASISVVSVSGSQLTATWNITLLTMNPNLHLVVDYFTIEPSIYDGHKKYAVMYDGRCRKYIIKSIAATRSSKPFFLDKGLNLTTLVNFKLAAEGKDVGYGLAQAISDALARGGNVRFAMCIRLVYAFRTKPKYSYLRGPHEIMYYCRRVEFVFAPNNDPGTGVFQGRQSRDCDDPGPEYD